MSGERITCGLSIVTEESREGIFEVRRVRKFSHESARQLRGSGCLDGRIPPFIFCVATENAATFARNFASMIRLGHSFLPAPFLFPLLSAPFLSLVKPRETAVSKPAANRSTHAPFNSSQPFVCILSILASIFAAINSSK